MLATLHSGAGRRAPRARLLVLSLCVACSGAVGCSGAVASPLGTTVWASTSGSLSIDLRSNPDPPERGTNSFEFTVRNAADGSPVDGVDLSMVPYMPAHQHGTSLVPVVTVEGQGKYLVSQVDLFMPGHWELQTTLSGSVSDRVVPAFDIP